MDSESRLRVSKSMKLEVSSWDRKFGSTWETLLNFSQCSFWHFSFLELKLFRTFVKLSIYSLTLITSITLVKLLQILKSEWTRSSHVASNKVSAGRHLGELIQLEKIIKALENSNFHNWIFPKCVTHRAFRSAESSSIVLMILTVFRISSSFPVKMFHCL